MTADTATERDFAARCAVVADAMFTTTGFRPSGLQTTDRIRDMILSRVEQLKSEPDGASIESGCIRVLKEDNGAAVFLSIGHLGFEENPYNHVIGEPFPGDNE